MNIKRLFLGCLATLGLSMTGSSQTNNSTIINQIKAQKTMDFFEVLKNRKSVRAYQDKEVEAEKLKAVVEAGNMAAGTPTAGPRYFNVITDQALIRRISEKTKEMMRQSPIERARQVGNNPKYDPTFHVTQLNLSSPIMAKKPSKR